MKVDIWSDIRCPFCYIGKRKFELGLDQFEHKDQIEVEWHSFELDPNAVTRTDVSAYDHLAEIKGQTRDWAVEMHEYVTNTAAEVGLDFDFEKSVVANSFNGHRLIQLAKTKGLADEIEERLFQAHFTEGANIDDTDTLIELGSEIGLKKEEIKNMLNSTAFEKEVRADEARAQSYGIRGVPFFILDNKIGVSGAQPPQTFQQALQQAWDNYTKENGSVSLASDKADSCLINGDC